MLNSWLYDMIDEDGGPPPVRAALRTVIGGGSLGGRASVIDAPNALPR